MYGVCYRPMSGYFYNFKVWAAQALTPAQLGFEITPTCGSACTVCPISGQCLNALSLILYQLDLEQNTQTIGSTGTVYQFQLGPDASSTNDPTRVPFQGLHFGAGQYVQSLDTISIPQIFAVEAYIRYDAAAPSAYGGLQYIYEITRNTNYFAIALDTNYLKVMINGFEGTYYQTWAQNTGWRYIGVTVVKQFADFSSGAPVVSSLVNVFIDRTLAATFVLPSFF